MDLTVFQAEVDMFFDDIGVVAGDFAGGGVSDGDGLGADGEAFAIIRAADADQDDGRGSGGFSPGQGLAGNGGCVNAG
jgi:hypothetical protein